MCMMIRVDPSSWHMGGKWFLTDEEVNEEVEKWELNVRLSVGLTTNKQKCLEFIIVLL